MLSKAIWLSLPNETRKKLATFLDIPKSAGIEVAGGGKVYEIISDGYTSKDLSKVNSDLLRKELGINTLIDLGINTEDFYAMFYELVRRVNLPVVELTQEQAKEQELISEVKEVKEVKQPELTSMLSEAEKYADEEIIDGKVYVRDKRYKSKVLILKKAKLGRPKKK